jgi:hypothetical protein
VNRPGSPAPLLGGELMSRPRQTIGAFGGIITRIRPSGQAAERALKVQTR